MSIDIILIAYNQEQYIAQAIESILMQRLNVQAKLRIIVADDFSTDNTLEIIKSYEKESPFPIIYLTSQANMGHVKNYQRAFASCSGDYTFVLEGDDYWCSPFHIQNHIVFLEEHNECSMSVNGIVLLWCKDNCFELHDTDSHKNIQYINIEQQIMGNHIGNHSSVCYRTKILQQIPDSFYCKSFDDALVGIWFAQYGFIAKLMEYTTVYRKFSKGLWTGLSEEEKQNLILQRLKINDNLFNRKYHHFFELAIQQYEKPKSTNILHYIPQIFICIGKMFLPKILLNKMKT